MATVLADLPGGPGRGMCKRTSMKLETRTALVTGGAVRIGKAIGEALAGAGCNIVVHFDRSGDEAADTAEEIRAKGVEAHVVKGSLAESAECERIMNEAWELAGGLDVLINNAAVFHKESLAESTDESLLQDLQVNLLAPIALTRAFASRLEGGGDGASGAVVNIVDRRISSNEPGCMPYLLSKKALAEFTRNAALELAPRITVNAVGPGAILAPSGEDESVARELAGEAPLDYFCGPGDVARAVVFLLESDGVTGQTLFVDSGQHLMT